MLLKLKPKIYIFLIPFLPRCLLGYDTFVLGNRPKIAVFSGLTNSIPPPLIVLESCSNHQTIRQVI